MKRAIYFGAGSSGKWFSQNLAHEEEILFFIDNDPARHGTDFMGKVVLPPSAILSAEYDHVRITSGCTYDIYLQLRALGIPEEKIVADLLEKRNVEFLNSLRGKHAGRRAFIVGNGPSLLVSDLEKIHLAGDVSFAFNKIYLLFGDANYRPTYYMVDDYLVVENNARRIGDLKGFPKLFPDVMLRFLEKDQETYVYGMTFQDGAAEQSLISENPIHLYSGWTVTYGALQMAMIMDCDPIYLIGVDFSYVEPPEERREGEVFFNLGERNHFHPHYRSEGEPWLKPNLGFALKSYESARRLAKKKGINIFNATRGGRLEAFERAELDSLF